MVSYYETSVDDCADQIAAHLKGKPAGAEKTFRVAGLRETKSFFPELQAGLRVRGITASIKHCLDDLTAGEMMFSVTVE